MRLAWRPLAGAGLLLLVTLSVGARELALERITDNVYAVLQGPAERFNDANSLIVVGREAAAVVDAQARPDGLAQVMAMVEQVSDVPLRYVINTHWHADHTQGNAAYRDRFGDQVRIVGHDSLFDDVPGRAAKSLRERVARVSELLERAEAHFEQGNDENGAPLDADALAGQGEGIARTRRWLEANRDARFLTPDISYFDTLSLDLGGVRLELVHLRAHTRGDTVVWLPKARVLASGDLLDDLPYVGHGYPRPWRDALAHIGHLGARVIVPGHGPVIYGDDKRRAIDRFLEALIEAADDPKLRAREAEALADGGHFAAARAELAGDDPTAGRFFDAVLVEAIERARDTAGARP